MPQDDINNAMTSSQVAIARMNAHESICTERYSRIATDTTDIKQTLHSIAAKLDESIKRAHDRIDGVAAEARGNAGLALSAAQDAKVGIQKAKVWAMSGIVAALITGVVELLKK